MYTMQELLKNIFIQGTYNPSASDMAVVLFIIIGGVVAFAALISYMASDANTLPIVLISIVFIIIFVVITPNYLKTNDFATDDTIFNQEEVVRNFENVKVILQQGEDKLSPEHEPLIGHCIGDWVFTAQATDNTEESDNGKIFYTILLNCENIEGDKDTLETIMQVDSNAREHYRETIEYKYLYPQISKEELIRVIGKENYNSLPLDSLFFRMQDIRFIYEIEGMNVYYRDEMNNKELDLLTTLFGEEVLEIIFS